MWLFLHIIVTYIKENVVTKLQKLYSPPRNPRAGSKLPPLFVKKLLSTGNLLPAHKIFIERPATINILLWTHMGYKELTNLNKVVSILCKLSEWIRNLQIIQCFNTIKGLE